MPVTSAKSTAFQSVYQLVMASVRWPVIRLVFASATPRERISVLRKCLHPWNVMFLSLCSATGMPVRSSAQARWHSITLLPMGVSLLPLP